ncbi:AAA family ATPase [Amycolatopsis benzoatilytica]|uniref:AAA family ATPase n=1 Tax=Amycolatopsis benzoatilytica TaxID=346045 RepID=UPI000480921F|nr:LuxR family transcriptional regulator [Amycolatopsis benzoatilytica]
MAELAGRDWEMRLLLRQAREAALGEGRAVLVRGPAGIGKTRMVSAALDELDGIARAVLTVRCPQHGSAEYEAVRRLLEPLVQTGEGAGPDAVTAGTAWLEPAALRGPDPGDVYAVMHGLLGFVAAHATEGLLALVVDDVQWSDETSLRWLGFLLRRAENLRLLVIMTQRTGPGERSLDALGEIGASPRCLTVDLGPLSGEAVAELLESGFDTAPEPAFAAKCGEVTGGNPHLLAKVIERLRGEVRPVAASVGMLEEVGRRVVALSVLDQLPTDTLAVARAIAVLGCEELEMIAALAAVRPSAAVAAVQALRGNGLLMPDRLEYAPDPVRAAIVEAVPPAELTVLRCRAATLLNDCGRPAEDVAVQLMLLEPITRPWMVNILRDAAAQAERRGASSTAARYLVHALEADEDSVAILTHLGRVLGKVDPRSALQYLERAYQLAPDPRERAPIVVQYLLISLASQDPRRAIELGGEVLAEFAAEPQAEPPRAMQMLRMMLLMSGRHETTAAASSGEHRPVVMPGGGRTAEDRELLAMSASLGALQGRPRSEVVAQAAEVLRLGNAAVDGWAALGAALPLYLADRIEPALAAVNDVLDNAQRSGEAFMHTLAVGVRALIWLSTGNLAEAFSDARSSLDRATQGPGPHWRLPHGVLACVHLHQDRPTSAGQVLNSAERLGPDQFCLSQHAFLMAQAKSLRALGKEEAALTVLRHCGDSLAEAGFRNPMVATWWCDAAEILAGRDRAREGRELIEAVEAAAEHWGTPRSTGMVRLARGMLTPGDAGIVLLEEAAERLAASPAKLELAKVEYLLGGRLLHRGDSERARERLRRAISLSVRCGDKYRLRLSLSALAAAGGRMRSGTASPADALSGSELRVAQRAAEGLTNREIADALFLAQRTVELHLTSVYRKLGINGRSGLTSALWHR